MAVTKFPAQFGKYILLDRISAGGMAEVYLAKVTGVEDFQRLVAIKCMLPALVEDAQFISMFVDEAKLASQLNHANIVQIYELGRLGERLYIAMELINGRDLRDIIKAARKRGLPIPIGFTVYAVAKAAEALDFAHRQIGVNGAPLNLVHRDVSPQNILMSFDGEPKVVDFGIAKAEARATKTQAGVLKGKFAYMAPEQITGVEIDRRADIFSLGVVLYEALTSKRLFTGDNDLSVLEKVRNAQVPSIRAAFPECPDELERVLKRALAKDRGKRYQWASEMAEDLEPLLIEDRSIFGTKRAAQFMQALYGDEIAKLKESVLRYAGAKVEDSLEVLGIEAPATDDFDIDVEDDEFVAKTTLSESPSELLAATTDSSQDAAMTTDWAIPTSEVFDPAAHPGGGDGSGTPDTANVGVVPTQVLGDADEPSTLFAKVLLGVLVAAVLVMGAAVIAALVTNRGQGAAVVVTPVEIGSTARSKSPPNGSGTTAPGGGAPGGGETTSLKAAPGQAEEHVVADKSSTTGRQRKFGYLSVTANGVARAKILVDGQEAGYLPLATFRVRTGKRQLTVIDMSEGKPGREKVEVVNVTAKHTRKAPLEVVVAL